MVERCLALQDLARSRSRRKRGRRRRTKSKERARVRKEQEQEGVCVALLITEVQLWEEQDDTKCLPGWAALLEEAPLVSQL